MSNEATFFAKREAISQLERICAFVQSPSKLIAEQLSEMGLSVEIRSGWTIEGAPFEAEEFRIVLCSGGPTVQIHGTLDRDNIPENAWIEYQHWDIPMTRLNTITEEQKELLLEFTQLFYYGE
jgi:hypothetical protein